MAGGVGGGVGGAAGGGVVGGWGGGEGARAPGGAAGRPAPPENFNAEHPLAAPDDRPHRSVCEADWLTPAMLTAWTERLEVSPG
ncbi:hypothetical protein PUR61_00300, partial [Streptomyces sp. BE20]|nr:hypothetical protein [Streptomyces sp. BE20]